MAWLSCGEPQALLGSHTWSRAGSWCRAAQAVVHGPVQSSLGCTEAEEIRALQVTRKGMSAKGTVRLVLSARTAMDEPRPALTVSLLLASSLVSPSFQVRDKEER